MPNTLPTTWDLIRSGLTAPPAVTGRRSWRRWLLTLGILIFLIPLGWFHRVCLALDRWLFPGFQSVELNRPLFIVGPPRSGTTYLHRLVAQDPRFTTFYLWELLLAPAVCQKRFWLTLDWLDSWLGHPAQRLLSLIEKITFAGLDDIHPTSLMDAEEDYFGLLPIHACFLLIVPFPDCPKLWDLARFDQVQSPETRTRVMNFYRGLLQRHLYVRGVHRTLVSKNPSFCGMLESLHDSFPTARFAVPIRTPEETLPSLLSSMEGGPKSFGYSVKTIEPNLIGMMRGYYQHIVDHFDELKDRATVVPYRALVDHPQETLAQLFEQLNYGPAETLMRPESSRRKTTKEYRSRHRYSLEQFGLDASTVRSEYSWLFDDPRMGLSERITPHTASQSVSDQSSASGAQSSC
jgi:hypothetical protein